MGCVVNAVRIYLSRSHEAGVKIIRHLFGRRHANILRQVPVQHERVLFRRDGGAHIKMRPLSQGMHSRVRPAGPCYPHKLTQRLLQRLFQLVLNAGAVILKLPAHVGRAIVTHRE